MLHIGSLIALSLAALAFSAKGREPVLRIISPTPGALVNPGESLTIDVSSTRDGVAVIMPMLGHCCPAKVF
jgi:hypothetical protein